LTAMRWRVREAAGGAEAMAQLEEEGAEAMVLDSVLPDLEVSEFAHTCAAGTQRWILLRWMKGRRDGSAQPRRTSCCMPCGRRTETPEAMRWKDRRRWGRCVPQRITAKSQFRRMGGGEWRER